MTDVGGVEFRRGGRIAGVPQESGGDQLLELVRGETVGVPPVGQFVTGHLLDQELVERFVSVVGPDHIVTVSPDTRGQLDSPSVVVGPDDVDVACDIQPVTSPAFPVPRIGQHTIDEPGPCSRSPVGEEPIDIRGVGRQSKNVEVNAANQRRQSRLGSQVQPGGFESRQHKRVNWRGHPAGSRYRGQISPHRGTECPPLAIGLLQDRILGFIETPGDIARPGSACHPGLDRLDVCRGGFQFLPGRHLAADQLLHQQAFLETPGNDGRTVLATPFDQGQ